MTTIVHAYFMMMMMMILLIRYALPNDEQIQWAFYIRPKVGDTLQRGVVQPAYGHDGGGIEAYFENGTSDDTYFDKKEYGE